jgi:hypothetical protein
LFRLLQIRQLTTEIQALMAERGNAPLTAKSATTTPLTATPPTATLADCHFANCRTADYHTAIYQSGSEPSGLLCSVKEMKESRA